MRFILILITLFLAIYLIWGWEGIDKLYSLGERVVLGCGDDDADDWVGRWFVEYSNGVRMDEDFAKAVWDFGDDVEGDFSWSYKFNSDGTMESEASMRFEGEGLSLSGGRIIRGNYTLAGDRFTIETERVKSTGFVKELLEEGEEGEEGDFSFVIATDGTWMRDGDTLTLTHNNNIVDVLKKE